MKSMITPPQISSFFSRSWIKQATTITTKSPCAHYEALWSPRYQFRTYLRRDLPSQYKHNRSLQLSFAALIFEVWLSFHTFGSWEKLAAVGCTLLSLGCILISLVIDYVRVVVAEHVRRIEHAMWN